MGVVVVQVGADAGGQGQPEANWTSDIGMEVTHVYSLLLNTLNNIYR